ncbi:hypothetical protein K3G39_06245 [Pontibacter sp. HSC-14F20]|nr:hypothetical protein [Pontibacter sp. HSC-14F20]
MIVPKPGSNHLYYLFTTDERSKLSPSNEGLRYSIVDMRLDNGRGDVVASTKNIPMFAESAKQLTVVRYTNGKDLWVLARNYQRNSILAFQLSENGIAAC